MLPAHASIDFILLTVSLVCFVASTFGVRSVLNLTAAGLSLLTLSMLL